MDTQAGEEVGKDVTMTKVKHLHVLEHDICDRSAAGFFDHHIYRLQNEYANGQLSEPYIVEFFDRRGMDCVAVLPFRRTESGVEVGVLEAFRPPLVLRSDRNLPVPESARMRILEAVAGSLELTDSGEDGIRYRAIAELKEETGYCIAPERLLELGAPFFPSHGQSTEKIIPFAADVADLEQGEATGDGSVNEALNRLVMLPETDVRAMCFDGRIEDPKVEVMLGRLNHVI